MNSSGSSWCALTSIQRIQNAEATEEIMSSEQSSAPLAPSFGRFPMPQSLR